jgi:hypothetical protein
MPNYSNGKIYTIRSMSRPDLIYVGSTTSPLSVRFAGHKCKKLASSQRVISIGDSYIELYENYTCNNKEELNRREGAVIRSMNCVNICIAGRTRQEYHQENKSKRDDYNRVNAKKIKEYHDKYDEVNKKHAAAYKKAHADRRSCICGSVYNYGLSSDRNTHFASIKHKEHVKLIWEKLFR